MKWLCALLASILLIDSSSAKAAVPGTKHRTGRATALSLRGGDLGQVSGKALATTFSAMAAADGLGGILAPIPCMKWCGVDIEKGSIQENNVHGIGASASSMALASYLATSGIVSTKEAIGYGLVVRLMSMTYMILTKKYSDMGMKLYMFGSMYILIAATIYALFTDTWDSLALTKVVSALLAFHGVFLYLKPEKFLARAVGADSNDSVTKDLASSDGGYMMLSGIVTGLVADGMDPQKVAGWGSLAYVPVIIKLMDVVQVESLLGVNVEVWLMVAVTILAAICAGTVGSG